MPDTLSIVADTLRTMIGATAAEPYVRAIEKALETNDQSPPLWRHAVTECNEAHRELDRFGVPVTTPKRRVRGPDGDEDMTIGLADRIRNLAAQHDIRPK